MGYRVVVKPILHPANNISNIVYPPLSLNPPDLEGAFSWCCEKYNTSELGRAQICSSSFSAFGKSIPS